ncbi:beta strand repeat-containing protein, partial [Lactiplantibacillus plantarum]|uniref:beta strand repeat-containing protein n=1 Tax=Lactiplantibacillus plantarum TaxID=1590 RepID=UPI001BBA8187|nr:hypothetical protein [Lactiplantibacillus plantarum]
MKNKKFKKPLEGEDLCRRYKMYKTKHGWYYASLFFLSMGTIFGPNVSVNADNVANTSSESDASVYTISSSSPTSMALSTSTSSSKADSTSSVSTSSSKADSTSSVSTSSSKVDSTSSVSTSSSKVDSTSSVSTSSSKADSTSSVSTSSSKVDSTSSVSTSSSKADSTSSVSTSSSKADSTSSVSTSSSKADSTSSISTSSSSHLTNDSSQLSAASNTTSSENTTQASQNTTSSETTIESASSVLNNATSTSVASDTVATTNSVAAVSTAVVVPTSYKSESSESVTGKSLQVKAVVLADTDSSSIDVTDGASLYKALSGNYTTINVMNDIDLTNYTGSWDFNYYSTNTTAIRSFTFNGNGHTIDFASKYAGFEPDGNTAMTITIEDVTMYGSSYWGPISFYNDGNTNNAQAHNLIFDNISYTGSQLAYATAAHIEIKGTVNVNSVGVYTHPLSSGSQTTDGYNQQNFQAVSLTIDDDATYNGKSSGGAFFEMVAGASGNGNLVIGKDATVNLTRTANNSPENGTSPIDLYNGNMTVGDGSKITINMDSSGSTIANRGVINLSGTSANLSLGKDATITINNTGSASNTYGININATTGQVNLSDGAILTINDSGLNNTALNMTGSGSLNIETDAKMIVNQATTTTRYGVVTVSGSGDIYVANGGELDILATNQGTTSTNLIYLAGTAQLSYGKDSIGTLSTDGTGINNGVYASGSSKVFIYRVGSLTINLNQSTTGSKLLYLNGNLSAEYVYAYLSSDATKGVPFKLLETTLSGGSATSGTDSIQGDNAAGEEILASLGTNKYIRFTAAGEDNNISITNTNSITDQTTVISGTANAGALIKLTDLNGNTVGGTSATIAGDYTSTMYTTTAGSDGTWEIAVKGLTADTVIVASGYNEYLPMYATAYVYSSEISSNTSQASTAASQAQSTSANAPSVANGTSSYATQASSSASQANSYATVNSNATNDSLNAVASGAATIASSASTSAAANNINIVNQASTAVDQYGQISADSTGNSAYASTALEEANSYYTNSLAYSDATAIDDSTSANSYSQGTVSASTATSSAVVNAQLETLSISTATSNAVVANTVAQDNYTSLASENVIASTEASVASAAYKQMLQNTADSSASQASDAAGKADSSAVNAGSYAGNAKSSASEAGSYAGNA